MDLPVTDGFPQSGSVRNAEQALAYAEHQMTRLREAVAAARLAPLVDNQRRLFHVALLRYGSALGTLATLRVTGGLDDIAYETLRREAVALMTPQVGVVTPT